MMTTLSYEHDTQITTRALMFVFAEPFEAPEEPNDMPAADESDEQAWDAFWAAYAETWE